MSVSSIRRVILVGMLLLAVGYRLGVHFGWFTSVTAPPTAVNSSGRESTSSFPTVTLVQPDQGEVARAFEQRASGVQVRGTGTVSKVLADDNQGSRHQRFILRMDSGQTLLIAHNIDVAGRVPGLEGGERVEFSGEYEWNEKGGLVHWTHHDPAGRHTAGWLKVAGAIYR